MFHCINIIRFIFLLAFMKRYQAFSDVGETMHFLNDLVKYEMAPCVLNVRMCWTRQETINLMQFTKSPIQLIGESNTIDIPLMSDLSNKIWFIVDMHCNSSQEFLQQVTFIAKQNLANFSTSTINVFPTDRRKIFSPSL